MNVHTEGKYRKTITMKIPSIILPRQASTQDVNSTISVDFVHPKLEIEDLYLMPLTVSKPAVSFRTIISNRLTTSWLPLASACTNVGPNADMPWYKWLENCYEDQLLDPNNSTTLKETAGSSFSVPSSSEIADLWTEAYRGTGVTGTDTLSIGGVDVPDLELNFATGINGSHAHVGLAKGSTLLDKLVEQGTIAARAFSLFVGTDVRYTQDWDPNAKDGDYPGSIVFGGLDFAKQGSTFMRGDLDGNGIPALNVTGIKVHDEHAVYDIMDQLGAVSYAAEIDVSSPFILVPQVTAEAIRSKRENTWNTDGDITSKTYHRGNISMVVSVMGDAGVGAREVNITMAESIWAWDKSYYVKPQVTKEKYFPFVINRSSNRARVILGRPFLKAAYLAINYDSNQFQVAPASYSSNSQIKPFQAVAADGSNRLESFPTLASTEILPTGTASPTSAASSTTSTAVPTSSSSSTSTGAIAGGVVGGVFGLLAIAGLFFLFLRRKNKKKSWTQNSDNVLPTPSTGGLTPGATGAGVYNYQQEPQQEYFKAELPATNERYAEQQYAQPGELEASPVGAKKIIYEPVADPQEVPASPVVPEAFVYVPMPPQPAAPRQERHELA